MQPAFPAGPGRPPDRRVPAARPAALGLLAVLLAGTGITCGVPGSAKTLEPLHPCTSSDGPTDALCGTLDVFEDREAGTGRRIPLRIVVLPALASSPLPDPLVFLAGGPGQGAAQMAPQIAAAFRPIQRDRDIVLVDQRGTGRSGPLDCRSDAGSLREMTESIETAVDRLRTCLDGYDADVRLYTTDLAMDDLDDVRAHLGYDRVNLYGGSYGTRAALVYLRRHGGHVRSVILDGVSPTDMRLPLFTARDAQRALDRLLSDCQADAVCTATFPDLPARIRGLVERLDREPVLARVAHPRTGDVEEVEVSARVVATILFGALYSPVTSSVVPAIVARAERGDFAGLFALALAGADGDGNMSVGMQLSVLCSEDTSRVTRDDLAREAAGSVFGAHLLGGQLDACALWPTRTMDPDYYRPIVSDVPALVLSGELDPVTPPAWGETVVRHLSRGRHLILPATGHGVVATPCGRTLVQEFLDSGSAGQLDTSCVSTVRRPPFFVSPAGPDPTSRAQALP